MKKNYKFYKIKDGKIHIINYEFWLGDEFFLCGLPKMHEDQEIKLADFRNKSIQLKHLCKRCLYKIKNDIDIGNIIDPILPERLFEI